MTQIRVPATKSDGEVECTFACAAPRVTMGIYSIFVTEKGSTTLKYVEIVPEHVAYGSDDTPYPVDIVQ